MGQVDTDTLEGFRGVYNLALDGSDDDADWSGNGIANIFYLAFGLGDPNEPNIDRSLLPTFEIANEFIMVVTYRQPLDLGTLTVTPQFSSDLTNWTDFEDLAQRPLQTNMDTINGSYDVFSHVFFNQTEWTFFRVKVEDSSQL